MSLDSPTARARRLPVQQLPHPLPDARRAAPDELEREVRAVSQSPVVAALLDASDTALLVLNGQRQIVAWNGRAAANRLDGLRPGEALACVNARDGSCGTRSACELCGALGAILSCQQRGAAVEAECLLRSEAPGASAEFNVRATPIAVEGRSFTVLSLRDISAEKRREALEQIFFHDLLNTVAGLRGWALRLHRPEADHARAGQRIDLLSRQLEREIRDHRALLLAERGALVPSPVRVHPAELLHDLELVFSSHAAARGRRLVVEPPPAGVVLWADPALLLRVLVNMVRNALEASAQGEAVRVWCERGTAAAAAGDEPEREVLRLRVHNAAVMPPEVQARIFQRSFSTKGERGRGLGTYSMKLLGERYLKGEVTFASAPGAGTVFSLQLPLDAPAPAVGPLVS
jgi:signal transduction histidine kinase